MRPVLLEMAGFASFREPTTVDFAVADYFALVGPTGAGKSTVIDAMTFALYGSVPRWDNQRLVAPGLAPTATRGTVRLVFDVGGDRYVVARELRRTSTGVQMKNSRLERLADPSGTGRPEEVTFDLAADRAVSEHVEKLLGLNFTNFCQCVVLPQGEFADFLREKPAKRQAILLRLLGDEHYNAIRDEASERAKAASQRLDLLEHQLTGFADATEDAEQAAADRERQVLALSDRVGAALPALTRAAADLTAAQQAYDALISEQQTLAALAVPAGVA